MDKTSELFCLINEFCQQFELFLVQRMLDHQSAQKLSNKGWRNRAGQMTLL